MTEKKLRPLKSVMISGSSGLPAGCPSLLSLAGRIVGSCIWDIAASCFAGAGLLDP